MLNRYIIKKNGNFKTITKCVEEMEELEQELLKRRNPDLILDEMADALETIERVRILFKISRRKLLVRRLYKRLRTIYRFKKKEKSQWTN